MKRGRRVIQTAWLLIGIYSFGPMVTHLHAGSNEAARVKATEELLRQTELRYDARAAGQLLADEFILTGIYGLFTKRQFLSLIADTRSPLDLLEYGDMRVRIYGDVAVVLSTIHEKAWFQGRSYELRGRRTAVWTKRSGNWMCVTIHESESQKDQSARSAATFKMLAS